MLALLRSSHLEKEHEMSRVPDINLNPSDRHIERNRVGRMAVLISYISIIITFSTFGGWKIAEDWFDFGMAGLFVGLAISGLILSVTLHLFFISVDLVSAFVTIDLLYTMIFRKGRTPPDPETYDQESPEEKKRDRTAFPSYGPGLHVCYPWEERDEENNFSLKEVSADTQFSILLRDGTVSLKGSYRIRPDIRNLVPFLSGVASTAEELEEIISAFAIEQLSSKTVDEALASIAELNEALYRKFGLAPQENGEIRPDDDVSNLERRFGVYVGDITIAEILPSQEVQRTRGSITEARAIAEGTAIMLSYKNAEELAEARKNKEVTEEQIRNARDRFLSVSGNLEGMELNRHEVDITFSGLDPEVAKALAEAARGLGPIAAAFGGRTKSKPSRTSKKK